MKILKFVVDFVWILLFLWTALWGYEAYNEQGQAMPFGIVIFFLSAVALGLLTGTRIMMYLIEKFWQ